MSKVTFLELAEQVLVEAGRAMTAREIWAFAEEKGYSGSVGTTSRAPALALALQLYKNTRQPDTKFARTPSRPAQFFLRSMPTVASASAAVPVKTKTTVKIPERALHPFVAFFAKYALGAHVKTIHHEQASKAAYGEWVFPDLVGFTYPIGQWSSEVLAIGKAMGSSPLRLFSFEVKKSLGLANLRQAFFQVVSNSSWAHRSYLVAADVSEEPELRQELRRLCSAHGIGIVKLDLQHPNDSAVLVEAAERRDLDWDTMNKLCTLSDEFRSFLVNIKNATTVEQIYESSFDKVMDEAELLDFLQKQASSG